jgi:signal transduction histidine kinase
MTNTPSVLRWWQHPLTGRGDSADRRAGRLTVGDVIIAAALTAFIELLVGGALGSPGAHGGAAAIIFAPLMTVPVLWRRRAPVPVAAVLAAGAAINGFGVGHMVRCGPALPALFFVAFALGRKTGLRAALPGLALLAVSAVIQSFTDPNLEPPVGVFASVFAVGFFGAGRLLTSRHAMVSELRERNVELREQREQTAQVAVASDRARIAQDLDGVLRQRLGEMADAAAAGRSGDRDSADAAFATIEDVGRQTLTTMREVVGALRPVTAPTAPQPVLAELSALLQRATKADARLHVIGTATTLPPGVELSGYRIVEHLLDTLQDDPTAKVDVTVGFTADALELTIVGPAGPRRASIAALAAARERVAVHGGSLASRTESGNRHAFVRLPLDLVHA